MKYSFLGLYAALIVANLSSVTSTIRKPTDVDIIGRFTRGALVIEKYDYVKSGKFNEVNFIETVDSATFKDLLKIHEFWDSPAELRKPENL